VRQPAGLVHGGIYASIAESLATRATETALADGAIAAGQNSQTSFLRPILEGNVHAAGRPRHRGRSTWVWEFDITDDAGRLCAVVRMTVAVRYPR
jgi:1,4-dihydroxy-2-naphthoyl-CoA hydrolase